MTISSGFYRLRLAHPEFQEPPEAIDMYATYEDPSKIKLSHRRGYDFEEHQVWEVISEGAQDIIIRTSIPGTKKQYLSYNSCQGSGPVILGSEKSYFTLNGPITIKNSTAYEIHTNPADPNKITGTTYIAANASKELETRSYSNQSGKDIHSWELIPEPYTKHLHIAHFNDVYNMSRTENKIDRRTNMDVVPISGNFDHLLYFNSKLNEIRKNWDEVTPDGKYDSDNSRGLTLFSGDLFSPSVESMLCGGVNMVQLINRLDVDAAVPGNHEFDVRRARFDELIRNSTVPWVLSNVTEKKPAKVVAEPEQVMAASNDDEDNDGVTDAQLKSFDKRGFPMEQIQQTLIITKAGLRVGVIGLFSKDAWGATNAGVKQNLDRQSMLVACKKMIPKLRKSCDIVIALTHAEHDEDLELGQQMKSYPVDMPPGIAEAHGSDPNGDSDEVVDIILGGHNHEYGLGRGVKRGRDQVTTKQERLTKSGKSDDPGLLIVKSGTDFEDISEIDIELRRKSGRKREWIVHSVTVTRHNLKGLKSDSFILKQELKLQKMLQQTFKRDVLKELETAIAIAEAGNNLNVGKQCEQETSLGNWIADTVLEAYTELEYNPPNQPRPFAFITTGSAIKRSDKFEGKISAREILALLPYEDPLVTIYITGSDLLRALNGALSRFELDSPGSAKIKPSE
ncbi:unnamed protein product [Rhizoctonia solani]|uniref:5'-Nucleotidase C-terminal domain-containing protein n=1 Tax=Rhizoctonia solani TaxID=456999 RepID=A0A8H3B570_9AGAM|nr:unnamed protein product [Rhizoctonia solani]